MNNLRLKLMAINLMTFLLVSCNGKKDTEARLLPDENNETSSEALRSRRISETPSREIAITDEEKKEDKVVDDRGNQDDSEVGGLEDENQERVCLDYNPAGNNTLRCDLFEARFRDANGCNGNTNTPNCESMKRAVVNCIALEIGGQSGLIDLIQHHLSAQAVGTSGIGPVRATWELHGGSWSVNGGVYNGSQMESQAGCDKLNWNLGDPEILDIYNNYCKFDICKEKAQEYLDQNDNPYAGLY